jgi:hypothetical protein
MKAFGVVLLIAGLVSLGFMSGKPLLAQRMPDGPTPIVPQPMEPTQAVPQGPSGREHFPGEPSEPEVTPRRKPPDLAKAKTEANELADLAQKVPGQVDQLSKNVLPKNLVEELKHIEKLAKVLRKQIEP